MTHIDRVPVEQRRICWPDFDRTCLEGGCGYCNKNPFRNVTSIERAVKRGKGLGAIADLQRAFDYGLKHNWHNAESRRLRQGLGERPECRCGCGNLTLRNDRVWIPGHRAKVVSGEILPDRQLEIALGATPVIREIP